MVSLELYQDLLQDLAPLSPEGLAFIEVKILADYALLGSERAELLEQVVCLQAEAGRNLASVEGASAVR